MKNKFMKKTLAAALALTLVSGAMPTVIGRNGLTKPAIVADAAEMNIQVGAKFYVGDTINFGDEGAYITSDNTTKIKEGEDNDNWVYYSKKYTGEMRITGAAYYDRSAEDGENGKYYEFATNISSDSIYILSEDIGENVGFEVVGGSGTKESPYEFKVIEQTFTGVALNSVNVALDDSITLRLYATKESVDAAGVDSVTLTGPNAPVTVTNFETDAAGTNYVFSYPLYATQLDDDVTIQFKKGNDIVQVRSKDSYSYKVNDYCDYVYGLMYSFNRYEWYAVKALKSLGIAAGNYFNDSAADCGFTVSTNGLTDFAPSFEPEAGKLSLVLDSKLAVRLYIEGLEAGAKSDDSKYTAVAGLDGKACFEVKALSPLDLGKQYDIEYNGKTYSFSALSYCARAVNSSNPKAVDLARTVYNYYARVKDYSDLAHSDNVVRVLDYGYPNNIFKEYRFSYTPGMTWAQLIENQPAWSEASLDENGFVWLDSDELLCDENGILVKADEIIDAGKTYNHRSNTSS